MPVLGYNSYNVKICAQQNWSIVISNFCSQELVEHHIQKYIDYSDLNREKALKKIKLCRTIFYQNRKNTLKIIYYIKNHFFIFK